MTPRDFSSAVVQARISSMDEFLQDLKGIGEIPADRLRSDRMFRHAVERILVQLVEHAVAINLHAAATLGTRVLGEYRSSFLGAADAGLISRDLAERLAPSAGLRNLLVHEYAAVDLDLLSHAAERALVEYGEYVREVARFLSDRS